MLTAETKLLKDNAHGGEKDPADCAQISESALSCAAAALGAETGEIGLLSVLKSGMTNRSYLLSCRGEKYIMRLPGEGTDKLIDRKNEAEVYRLIAPYSISDELVYIDPESGYKITKYLENARNCDPHSEKDVEKAMALLRRLHSMELKGGKEFDIFKMLDFYEELRCGRASVYPDYEKTKAELLALRPYIEAHGEKKRLCHIDPVCDNFIFAEDREGREVLRLIDWEYAGQQDPDVDLAMFCIYALYDREQTDRLIDCYFKGDCGNRRRSKIYCLIAACGLLWSNWCEYKQTLGVKFGQYSRRQYEYAREFPRYARELREKNEG